MTIEYYNYKDEPSNENKTLEQTLKRCECLEKQLKIAIEALEFYEKPIPCFHYVYDLTQHHKKAAETLVKIRSLENEYITDCMKKQTTQ